MPPSRHAQSSRARGSRIRRARRWAFGSAILLLALYLVQRLVAEVGWADLAGRARAARPAPLAIAALFLLGHLGLRAWRWLLAVRRIDPAAAPPRPIVFAALAASVAVNLITPVVRILGGLLRARYVSRSGTHSIATHYGAVLFDQAAHTIVMGIIALCAVVAGSALAGRTTLAAILGGALLIALTLCVLWAERLTSRGQAALARTLEERASRRGGRTRRFLLRSRETLATLARLLADRALRYQAALLGLAAFLTTALAQAAVFRALDLHPGPLVVLVTVALSTAAGTLSGTPGGLGTTEAAMIALYVALDMNRLDAAAAALLYRAIFYVVIFAAGLPAALFLEIRLRRQRRTKRGQPAKPV